MRIVDFAATHIEQVVQIIKQNYEDERRHVPALPFADSIPDMMQYTKNGLGVAALEGDRLVGFLCALGPFSNAFHSTDAIGVFSPMGANGAILDNRAYIYARMYQAAGDKWVRARASSHAVCLYAHDTESQNQLFRYGFGQRCVDAIRELGDVACPPCNRYSIRKVTLNDALIVLPLENMLHRSYIESPFFVLRAELTEAGWLEYWQESKPTCYVAEYDNLPVAFIIAELDGETFEKNTPGYQHITGLYCMPEHRGKGVSQNLLNALIREEKANGKTRLGVDYESINPSGAGFWQKYFTEYTYSVVRRIDEHALPQKNL
jgi:GNAT superfamily N-acetyltransferase